MNIPSRHVSQSTVLHALFEGLFSIRTEEGRGKLEDDNPFAKYNYTRRKRQSDVWIRLAKIGGAVLFFGLLFLIYKSASFRSHTSSTPRVHKGHAHSDDGIVRENATLVMLVRYIP